MRSRLRCVLHVCLYAYAVRDCTCVHICGCRLCASLPPMGMVRMQAKKGLPAAKEAVKVGKAVKEEEKKATNQAANSLKREAKKLGLTPSQVCYTNSTDLCKQRLYKT